MPEGRMITEAGTRELTATLGALALALPLWISGCERSDDAPASPSHGAEEQPAADLEDPTRQQLQELGYLDFAETRAEEGVGGVVHSDAARVAPGYNLYTSRSLCLAELVDMDGRVVHSWHHQPCRFWSNAELLPNGDLLVTGLDRTREDQRTFVDSMYLLHLSWDGSVDWKRPLPAHHDVDMTPDGRLLTLSMRYRRIPEINPALDTLDNGLMLLSAEGELLEEVSLFDLFRRADDRFRFLPVKPTRRGGGSEIDLFHANSVDWLRAAPLRETHPILAPGNILMCFQRQDTIAVVDWARKEVVWAWGQGELSGPHHPSVLENGNILIFDNGVSRGWSRVVELDPISERIVWEYRAPKPRRFFTRSRGASQRLPNGNTLITNSDRGEAFEVTPGGDVVWSFANPHLDARGHRATIVRMKRYEASMIEALLAANEQPQPVRR